MRGEFFDFIYYPLLLVQEYCCRVCTLLVTRILEYAILVLIARPMTFGKIASVRNGSEVICEVKAELCDDGIGAGKLRDVVVALEQGTRDEREGESARAGARG